jgi:hypothetical protein
MDLENLDGTMVEQVAVGLDHTVILLKNVNGSQVVATCGSEYKGMILH